MPFLELENLSTYFEVTKGLFVKEHATVKAVDNVSLTIEKGEILGLVGESGCGKSTLSRTVMQLIPPTAGSVILEGRALAGLDAESMRLERINFQMIFQDPYASLNPRMTVFSALSEALRTRHSYDKAQLVSKVANLMELVGLDKRYMRKSPHEFSGGQRQRIAIARALAPEPKLLIADEPVSALDVSIQSQILNLLLKLTKELNLTMLFISHDLSVVRYISDRIAVMYLGKIVELGSAEDVMDHPIHAYTRALVSAIPRIDAEHGRTNKLAVLEGEPPSPLNPPPGCAFGYRTKHPRYPESIGADLSLVEIRPGHFAAKCPCCVEE